MKAFGDGLVEEFFLLHSSPFIEGDLDDDQVIGAIDAQILGIKDEMLFVVFGQDLEVVVFRYANGLAHGGIDQLSDAFGVGGVLMFFDVDAYQWHGKTPEGCRSVKN